MKLSTKILTVLWVAWLTYSIWALNVLWFVLTTQNWTPTSACGYWYWYGTSYGYWTVACPTAAGWSFSSSSSSTSVVTNLVNQVLTALDWKSSVSTLAESTTSYGYGSPTSKPLVCTPAKLNDILKSKYTSQISTLVNKCIVRWNNISYSPKMRVSASEFTKIVLKSLGISTTYTDSFQKAVSLKIVPSTMKPSAQLTKTQAYSILKNALKVAKKKSLTKIPSSSRNYITREESAQLIVNAIWANNIPVALSKE